MKRYLRTVAATEEKVTAEDRLNDTIDQVKEDFDYAIDGINQLASRLQMDDANAILESLRAAVDQAIDSVSSAIIE